MLHAFNANIKNDYHILAPAGGRITAILVRCIAFWGVQTGERHISVRKHSGIPEIY